jgi:hypothetical protein
MTCSPTSARLEDFDFSCTVSPALFYASCMVFCLHREALGLATICILIRSCFRVAELSEGFGGKLANQQVTFMILEGAMVLIACICLTVFHPGVAFGGRWKEANFRLRIDGKDRMKFEQEDEKT